MRVADVEEGVEEAREIPAEHQRRHPCFVGLEGQGDDVAHEAHVVSDVLRQTVVGTFHVHQRSALVPGAISRLGGISAHAVHALLHLADAGQVFVETAVIFGTDCSTQGRKVLPHAIQNAPGALVAAVLEEGVESQRWVHLHRHR